jgi:hypothetical protein
MKIMRCGFGLSVMLLLAAAAFANDAFYKTPAGQALINKKPLMMQNMMDEMRALLRPLVDRIGQIRTEAEQEIKALPAPKPAAGNPPS